MHPHGMSASCHGKEDVLVLAGLHLHTGIGFTILCKMCGGKMMIEVLMNLPFVSLSMLDILGINVTTVISTTTKT